MHARINTWTSCNIYYPFHLFLSMTALLSREFGNAASRNSVKVVECLLPWIIDIDSRDFPSSKYLLNLGLFSACRGGHVEMVKYMLTSGATTIHQAFDEMRIEYRDSLKHVHVGMLLISHGALFKPFKYDCWIPVLLNHHFQITPKYTKCYTRRRIWYQWHVTQLLSPWLVADIVQYVIKPMIGYN